MLEIQMELLYDENLLPRILMTVTAIALAIGPAVADFNKTHATNPLWPPHARFHVVWQVITNSSLCLMMLYILWTPLVAQYNLQLILVAIVQGAILAPLYVTIASMGLFDGALKDVNGLPTACGHSNSILVAGSLNWIPTLSVSATLHWC
jgi:small-conductance mechanosensitive channel